jgi:hypothetical protein
MILIGEGVAFNLADEIHGMGDELGNAMRGIRMAAFVTESIQGGTTDNNAVTTNQQPAAGGEQDLDIDGNEATDGVATLLFCGKVSITSSGNDVGTTFTVIGDDANGRPQAEEIAGPNTTTLEGNKHFTKIRRVFVSQNTVGIVSVGQLETGTRGLRRKAMDLGQSFKPRSDTNIAVEGGTIELLGSFSGGSDTTQTATNADQRARYQPVALTSDIEVTYLADLTKEGIGENYTDSSQNVPSAI